MEQIPLRSCRQFVMDHVVLANEGLNEADKNIDSKVEKLLASKVDKMVEHCHMNRYFYDKQPMKPLVRLKCDYTNFETINENRFAQKFIDKVANPRNILMFHKRASESITTESALDNEAAKVLRMHGGGEQLEYGKVHDIVNKYFKVAEDKNKLTALTDKGLGDAIQEYIEKDEKDAISELINFQIEKIQKYLKNQSMNSINDAQLTEEIKKFQRMRLANQEEEDNEVKSIFEKTKTQTQTKPDRSVLDSQFDKFMNDSDGEQSVKKRYGSSDEDLEADLIPSKPARGKGSRGGRGSRGGGRGSRGGRGAKATQPTQSKITKSAFKYNNDSDCDIIDLDNNSADTKPLSSYKPTQSTLSTTSSQRRNRIAYEDDDEEEEIEVIGAKPNKKKSKHDSDDADDYGAKAAPFSIFKRVAKKKL